MPDLQALSFSDPMLNARGSDKDWWGSDITLSNIDGLDTFDNTLFAVNFNTEWSVGPRISHLYVLCH